MIDEAPRRLYAVLLDIMTETLWPYVRTVGVVTKPITLTADAAVGLSHVGDRLEDRIADVAQDGVALAT